VRAIGKTRRIGGELLFVRAPFVLESEYMTGEDNVSTSTLTDKTGWYALAGYSLGPKKQVVARYDYWDPNTHLSGDAEDDLLLGLNWYLAKNNAKFQVNLVRKNFQSSVAALSAGFPADTDHANQLLANLQAAF